MLLNLHVKNFAIIDEVDVTFTDNLNILTGETGAGKSIIIGSINVALGGKVTKDIIRKGADYALVELLFVVDNENTLDQIKNMDILCEDNQVIISRKIMNGKSICKINGETVTTSTVKEVASLLIDIHGQHEHQSLLYKEKHLEILDHFSREHGLNTKKKVEDKFKEYSLLKQELSKLNIDEERRIREISFLEYEINEIKEANLKLGEDELLFAEFKRLSNSKTLGEGLNIVYQYMGYDKSTGAGDLVGRSLKQLSRLLEHDKNLESLAEQAASIEDLLNGFNRELSEYLLDLNDTEDFSDIEKRLDLIQHLKAKYGSSISDIIDYCSKSELKLEQYYNYEDTINNLNRKLSKTEEELAELCLQLSEIRQEASKLLVNNIKEALIDLNFLDVSFEMTFTSLAQYTSNGYDEAEFIISTNPGELLRPLGKVASGGELSRIMLAIKSVLANKDDIDTLIFDEIDVGVSGRTAQRVSEKLAGISKEHQVLCITHLPQIAAMADSHYIIEKETDGVRTNTSIKELNMEESVDELARILGGALITESVLYSAKEMKELASRSKKC